MESSIGSFSPELVPDVTGVSYAHRIHRVFSTHGPSPSARVSQVRESLPWQLQGTVIHLYGPIPVYGLCTTHLSRKLARYRSVSAGRGVQALPHGYTRADSPQHPG